MATALVTQIAYAVQSLFDPAGTAGRLVDLGKLANYGLLTSFTPAYLFTSGAQGAWYDPSDYSTLFQNAAGTTPVTAVEQPVGLMLDKSKGLVLGPELVTNGTFGTDINGWSVSPAYPNGTISWNAGKLRITLTGTGWCVAYFNLTGLKAGSQYNVLATSSNQTTQFAKVGGGSGVDGSANAAWFDSGNLSSPTSLNRLSGAMTATAHVWVGGYGTAGQYVEFDNISVKELPGNHAFNGSGNSANFPVLSARYNLLTKTEQFDDNSVWTKGSSTVDSSPRIDPFGGNAAQAIYETTDNSSHFIWQNYLSVSSGVYTASCYLKAIDRQFAFVAIYSSSASQARIAIYVDFVNKTSAVASGSPGTPNNVVLSEIENGWFKVSLTFTASDNGQSIVIFSSNTSNFSNRAFVGDVNKGIAVFGADLRVANDALGQPAYQRVNTSTDYDTVGFKPYLRFNGTNQWLQTNSIDFSYGDKMFVSAGVRRLGAGIICETGVNASAINGSFHVYTENLLYQLASRGTVLMSIVPVVPSLPITDIITGKYEISTPLLLARRNGSVIGQSSQTQGTGNYGNYPMFIGARNAGASLWFNGRLYGLVAAGKQASAAEITSTETYLNQKTGAF